MSKLTAEVKPSSLSNVETNTVAGSSAQPVEKQIESLEKVKALLKDEVLAEGEFTI